ncbi:MAG: succinylglutamate desuccinylase/aspartoacylase family protein [Chloroflexi bacterium]|nr:succinylglutamate desuccinylase/aspartoacylase family protein [Chloroflexota bacterium]
MPSSLGPIPVPSAGQSSSGYFTFAGDPQLARYQWPYFSFAGAGPGPTFLLTAGIHAAEYTGIVAAIRLGRLLEPGDLKGTVVIVPLLNRGGFYERLIYVNPEDHDNMNRVFPGSPDGPWSERFAYHLLNEVVVHADYAVDLHAGDMIEDLEPFVIYRQTGVADVDRRAREMVDAYGVRWALKGEVSGERPGMLFAAAAERGVPAMIAESGRCGLLEEEAVARHVRGVQNILRRQGILAGAPAAVEPPHMLSRFEWLRSEYEGIFLPRVRVSQTVAEGEPLGEMIDLLGNRLAEVSAPVGGIVLFTVTSPAIKQGGLLLGIGVD